MNTYIQNLLRESRAFKARQGEPLWSGSYSEPPQAQTLSPLAIPPPTVAPRVNACSPII